MSLSREMLITNKRGLHARASAKFVQTVSGYDATVHVTKDGTTVGGTSIMGLMMLGAACGTSIDVSVEGTEAPALAAALRELVAGRFGESI